MFSSTIAERIITHLNKVHSRVLTYTCMVDSYLSTARYWFYVLGMTHKQRLLRMYLNACLSHQAITYYVPRFLSYLHVSEFSKYVTIRGYCVRWIKQMNIPNNNIINSSKNNNDRNTNTKPISKQTKY